MLLRFFQLSSRRLSIGPAMSATMAIKLIERNAHVCFKLITRTTITWKAPGSESKKQYGNQLFHFLPLTQQPSTRQGETENELSRVAPHPQ